VRRSHEVSGLAEEGRNQWVVGASEALERLALEIATACGVDLVDLYAEPVAAIEY
jgi:hypothetical protein